MSSQEIAKGFDHSYTKFGWKRSSNGETIYHA